MKKSQSLPIDLVVKIIIGLIIFGMGYFLFQKIFLSSEDKVSDLGNNVRENLESIGCDGSNSICIATFDLRQGEVVNSKVVVTNKDTTNKDLKIGISDDNYVSNRLEKESCGNILIVYYDKELNIKSQKSSEFPIQIEADNIIKRPCSFISKINLLEGTSIVDSTPLIINIK